jgi:hypothetical protein
MVRATTAALILRALRDTHLAVVAVLALLVVMLVVAQLVVLEVLAKLILLQGRQ